MRSKFLITPDNCFKLVLQIPFIADRAEKSKQYVNRNQEARLTHEYRN